MRMDNVAQGELRAVRILMTTDEANELYEHLKLFTEYKKATVMKRFKQLLKYHV